MKLETYIAEVDNEISDLTNDDLYLAVLPDTADGEYSLTDLHADGITPRMAAVKILWNLGMEDALNCWSDMCDDCDYLDECPHIG